MLINEEQLDLTIRQSLAAKVQALYRKPAKTQEEMLALSMQQPARPVRPSIGLIARGVFAGIIGGFLCALIPGLTFLWGAPGTVAATLIVIGYWAGFLLWIIQTARGQSVPSGFRTEDFGRLMGVLELTPVERAYCEAVSALADDECALDESTARQTLEKLNALVRQLQRVDGSLEYFERTGGVDAIARLESERSAISELIDGCSDSAAREDLEQSLSLCNSRVDAVRGSGPAIERLQAQRTLLVNTLQSTAASLTRLRNASAGLNSTEVEQVTASLALAAVNIESTERALHEVASIGTS